MLRKVMTWPRSAGLLILVISIIISIAAILSQSGEVMEWPMDQAFVTRADLRIFRSPSGWVFQYPRFNWSGGVTPSLIIGLYKLIATPAAETLNWHAKSITSVLFLSSSYLLTAALIRPIAIQLLAFLIIASSALQFAEPSSDIIAASLFATFLASIKLGWHRSISAGLLIMFGVSKIQLLLSSLGVGLFWYLWDFRRNGKRWQVPVYMLIWLTALLGPGLKMYGMDMLRTVKGDRTFATTYILLFSDHQLVPLSRETLSQLNKNYSDTMQTIFPGAKGIISIIINYPKKYFDFFAISFARSADIVLTTMGLTLIPFFMALGQRLYPAYTRLSLYFLAVLTPLSLLPPLLLRFISPRYLAVVYIPVVALSAAAAAQKEAPKSFKLTFFTCAFAALLVHLFLFQQRLESSPFMLQG